MKLVQEHKINSNERVWTIDWHPQGHVLASAGSSKNFTLWKYKNEKFEKIATMQTEHTKTIRSVKFSHKGDKIAVGSFDQTISVWMYNNEVQDYEMLSTLSGHINEVKCVRWSRDDKKIASCSRDKNIWIWEFDAISFDYVCYAILEGHTQDVKFVEWFSNQENKLVSASYDDTIRIWEGQDDDYICKQVLEGHKSIVWCVQIVNTSLFSASEDSTVIQWQFSDKTQKYQIQKVYEGLHNLSIYTLCISKSKYIITGGGDNMISVSEIQWQKTLTQRNISAPILCTGAHESDINCLKLNPKEQNIIASCSDDQAIKIWKLLEV